MIERHRAAERVKDGERERERERDCHSLRHNVFESRVWISPLFPKLRDSGGAASGKRGDSPTNFKADLLAYIAAYRTVPLKQWEQHIQQHDMSSARSVDRNESREREGERKRDGEREGERERHVVPYLICIYINVYMYLIL